MGARPAASQELDPRLRALLSRLRWGLRLYGWLQGAALAVAWLGLTFWAGLALDYLPVLAGASEMPRWARAGVLAIVALVLGRLLYRWGLRRILKPLTNRDLAVILERRFPQFRDSLITAVELSARADDAAAVSAEAWQHTVREAVAWIPSVRLRDVFNYRPLRRWTIAAAGFLATVLVFAVLNREGAALWARRLYALQDTPWPRRAQIEVVGVELLGPDEPAERVTEPPLVRFADRTLKVARGSNLRLLVRAELGAAVVPNACTLHYCTDEGVRGRETINRSLRGQGSYQLYSFSGKPLRGILSSLRFDVVGYDYRVRDYQIEVVDSPAVIGVDVECRFPDYLADEPLGLWAPRTVELTGATQLPYGTEVTLRVRTNKPLVRAELYNPDSKETATVPVTAEGDAARQFAYPVGRLRENLTLDVSLHDVDQVVNERPHRLFLPVVPDEAPRVEIALRGIGTAVTPDVQIPARGTITDDYAVARAWYDVELVRATTPADQPPRVQQQHDFPLQAAGKVDATLDFRALRATPDGLTPQPKDKLLLVIKAADKYDLGQEPNTGSSDRYQLDVVTPDQLLTVLEAREIGLRRRFEQIIDEMTQARDFLQRVAAPPSQRGAEPEDRAGEPDSPKETPASKPTPAERTQSLRLIRTQQSLQQTQKSAQEVLGLAAAFRDLREELINNRLDTEDRKHRLQTLIAEPLERVGETSFPELERRQQALEQVLLADLTAKRYDGAVGTVESAAALEQANDLLAELQEILQQMLDLETFNELLDIVRKLIEDQDRLKQDTAKEQKSLLRD